VPLPDDELGSFLITVTDALKMARAGDIENGYIALLAGLHRAKEIAAEGQPWGAELVRRYQEAVENDAPEWRVGRA
jgi:hypothetical protein